MKLNTHKPLVLAIITALLLSAAQAQAQAETATPAPAVTPATATTTPAAITPPPAVNPEPPLAVDSGEAVQNQAGIEALKAIHKASEAIGKKDAKAALSDVDEAAKLLTSLKDSLPVAKLKGKLTDAKNNPDTADWTNIYQQLDKITVFMPVKAAKEALGDTKAKPTPEALDAAMVALQYTELDLPVATAQADIAKAQTALKKEDLAAAEKALQAAGGSVVLMQSIVEDPLYQAHLSLWQALANLKNGSEADAKRYLDDAIGFLEKAKQSTGKATQEAADKLLTEGKALKAEIDKPQANDVVGKLERFGLHSEAWAERAMNYAHSEAAKASGEGGALKNDLIEARFHLSNAIIDFSTAQEPAAAKTELEQAQTFLKHSLQQTDNLWTDATYKKQVTDVQAQLDKLLQEPASTNGSTQLQTLRQNLQTVIQTM